MGAVFDIQRYCLHDGAGIRTTVFFKGCPLRCVWCHNPEGQGITPVLLYTADLCRGCGRCAAACDARTLRDGKAVPDRARCTACGRCVPVCPAGANRIAGTEMTAEEVFSVVLRDRDYYETSGGGMTLSGGEPSYQPAFALSLLRLARDAGIGRAIETAGVGTQSFYGDCAACGTAFLYDLKCLSPEKHKALTGVLPDTILANLGYLFSIGADIVLRLPLIPGHNDTAEDISRLCDFLTAHRGQYRYAEIMPYHPLGRGKGGAMGLCDALCDAPAPKEAIVHFRAALQQSGAEIRVSDAGLHTL